MSSGISSSAAAAVAYRLGLCDSPVKVKMPGGLLDITIGKDLSVKMKGPVVRIYEGTLFYEAFI